MIVIFSGPNFPHPKAGGHGRRGPGQPCLISTLYRPDAGTGDLNPEPFCSVEVALLKDAGNTGNFEITHDDELLFSKKESGAFPDKDALEALAEKVSSK